MKVKILKSFSFTKSTQKKQKKTLKLKTATKKKVYQ